MESPVAMPLSLITVDNNHIESEDTDWEEEDAELGALSATDTQKSLDISASADDDALLDTPDEEQDLGALLSQHCPSLQWMDTTFNTDQEDGIKTLIFNSESQGTDWDDDFSDDEDEEDEGAPLGIEKENSRGPAEKGHQKQNAKLLPLGKVRTEFLGRLVKLAFSPSIGLAITREVAALLR